MNTRIKYLLLTLAVMFIGLMSRRFSSPHSFIHDYVGDALWAAMAYFGFRFLTPQLIKQKAAIVALLFCMTIEISQLYQAPWIDAIRQTSLGGLVLGSGFLWTDLVSYALGILGVYLWDNQRP